MIYFLKHISEVFAKFKEFEGIITNDSGFKIGRLRTDNGGEDISSEFEEYLKFKGICHEVTVPYTPEQNGVAERLNCTLIEAARSMISHAKLNSSYWGEAVATAAYVRNRTVTTATGTTPYERWYNRKPDVSNLKVFSCIVYAHIPDAVRQKLDMKAVKVRFVGYSTHPRGYRLLTEATKKVIIRRDVTFNETEFSDLNESVSVENSVVSETASSEPVVIHKPEVRLHPERQVKPPTRYGIDEYADAVSHDTEHSANICQTIEPSSMQEALQSDYATQWKLAADSEYESLMYNKAWELVELPANRSTIGCKWVFRIKYRSNGEVEHFKARLVAKGFAQKHEIDYDETFSPAVRFVSIRALLAFAVQHGMIIHQMDVVTAFLNGELEEELYMQQPEGYVQIESEHLVCMLIGNLYMDLSSPQGARIKL